MRADAASVVPVMEDPEAVAPAGTVRDHRVVWNVDPDTTTVSDD